MIELSIESNDKGYWLAFPPIDPNDKPESYLTKEQAISLKSKIQSQLEERDIFKKEFIENGSIGWKIRCKDLESQLQKYKGIIDEIKGKVDRLVKETRKDECHGEENVCLCCELITLKQILSKVEENNA